MKTKEQERLEQFSNLLDGYKHKNDMVLIVRMMNALGVDYGLFVDDCIKAMREDVKAKLKEMKDASAKAKRK